MAESENQVKPDEPTKLSKAIEMAKKLVDPSVLPKEDFIGALDPLLKARLKEFLLGPDEDVVLIVRQSLLRNPIPALLIFTNKKIIIAQPSIMHFFGIKHMAIKSSNVVQYNRISDLKGKRGLFLRTISLIILGAPIVEIEGIRRVNAELVLKFLSKVLEVLG